MVYAHNGVIWLSSHTNLIDWLSEAYSDLIIFVLGCLGQVFMVTEMLEASKGFATRVKLWSPPHEWLCHVIILHTSHNCFKSKWCPASEELLATLQII